MDLPRRYGRYILEERLGQGGMAEVFRARIDEGGFQKRVCIKRMLPALSERAEFANMFRDEAALAARLQHPNLVQALDFGKADGSLFLVLELVDGVSLERVLRALYDTGERIPVTNALMIAMSIARGLHAAHKATAADGKPLNIIHRDVTPSNVLLSAIGEVKVIDFGVAHASERITHTVTGIMKGKPGYFTPEQALGEALDHRVDQFQTGIVLWEMLAGKQLFRRKKEMQTLEAVLACDVPSLTDIRDDVPPAVDDVVHRALQRDPRARFLDMSVFEAAIAAELYPRVRRPGHLDLRALVERTRDLERDHTARIERARPPGTDTDPSGDVPHVATLPVQSADVTAANPASPSSVTRSLEADATIRSPVAPGSMERTALLSARRRPPNAMIGAALAVVLLVVVVVVVVAAGTRESESTGPPESAPRVTAGEPEGASLAREDAAKSEPASAKSVDALAKPAPEPIAEIVPARVEQRAAADDPPRRARTTAAQAAAQTGEAKRLALQGRFQEAAALLEDVTAADPDNADAYRTLGVCYAKLGDKKRAARNYARYLLLRPDAPDAAEVRKALSGTTWR